MGLRENEGPQDLKNANRLQDPVPDEQHLIASFGSAILRRGTASSGAEIEPRPEERDGQDLPSPECWLVAAIPTDATYGTPATMRPVISKARLGLQYELSLSRTGGASPLFTTTGDRAAGAGVTTVGCAGWGGLRSHDHGRGRGGGRRRLGWLHDNGLLSGGKGGEAHGRSAHCECSSATKNVRFHGDPLGVWICADARRVSTCICACAFPTASAMPTFRRGRRYDALSTRDLSDSHSLSRFALAASQSLAAAESILCK